MPCEIEYVSEMVQQHEGGQGGGEGAEVDARSAPSPPRTSRPSVIPRAVSWKSRSSTQNP